jgi:acyl-CoA reductase-like NAD-dependent aldehyde dehydrogenase
MRNEGLSNAVSRGGNDAAIVCKSVDVKKTAPSVGMLALLNSGQVILPRRMMKRPY